VEVDLLEMQVQMVDLVVVDLEEFLVREQVAMLVELEIEKLEQQHQHHHKEVMVVLGRVIQHQLLGVEVVAEPVALVVLEDLQLHQ
jgi:hypothetical protein